MGIIKTLIKRAGKGILAALVVLMFSSLSFAATTVYVYQKGPTGALTVKTIDCYGNITSPANVIPNSCSTPDLFWDPDFDMLRINGFDSTGPAWTGTIDAAGKFTPATSPNVTCASATDSVVSATLPALPTVMGSQACTSWKYGSWTPSPCAVGSIQTRTATGSPSGCLGFPDAATVQSCPPQTCTSFTYACNGTCSSTTSTCPAIVTGSSPSGCVGGSPLATISCTPGVACTGYSYSSWGTCTNGSQSRTVTGYTPAGCTGTPSSSAVLTQTCSTTTPGDPSGAMILQVNSEVNVPLNAKATQYFKFTTPAGGCSKTLDITMINVSLTYGDGQLLVKSSNHGASSWPTLADYTYEFGLNGYSVGRDWTRDPNGGAFFWKWAIGVPGEVVSILPSYPTDKSSFSNDDTFYLLLYNQGTTPNNYRVKWQCYQQSTTTGGGW